MEVLLLGHPKSKVTRKAQRYFADRRIPFHDRDLRKRPASPGELRRWVQRYGVEALVDEGCRAYTEGGLRYLSADADDWVARLVEDPTLLRLPLVRCGDVLSVGDDPDGWQRVADAVRAG